MKFADTYVAEYNIDRNYAVVIGYEYEHDTGATVDVYHEEFDATSFGDALDRFESLGFIPAAGEVTRTLNTDADDDFGCTSLIFTLDNLSLR